MGLTNPAPGVVDFDGFRALQPLYDAAREAGVWVVLRPGKCVDHSPIKFSLGNMTGPVSVSEPVTYNCSDGIKYINAETTAGGIAHWATTEVAGSLRTNATDWKAAWQDYILGIINVTAPNQISNGGPVIGVSKLLIFIPRTN